MLDLKHKERLQCLNLIEHAAIRNVTDFMPKRRPTLFVPILKVPNFSPESTIVVYTVRENQGGKFPFYLGQGMPGKLAMLRGRWHFCAIGRGKCNFCIITEVSDLFSLHVKFIFL